MDIKKAGIETVKFAATAAFVFTSGALTGNILGASPSKIGLASVVAFVAQKVFDSANRYLANKFDWNLSNYQISKTVGKVLIGAATVVSLFALGIIGPVGAGVMAGFVGLSFAFDLGVAIYLKKADKDLAMQEAKNTNPKELNYAQDYAMA